MKKLCLFAWALVLVVGCDGSPIPSAPAPDGGPPVPDATTPTDASVPDDGSVVDDGATPADGSILDDGSVPADGSVSEDGSVPFDGGAAVDGSTADGGVLVSDGGMFVDAGSPDAGPSGCSAAACDDGISCTEDTCAEDGRCVHLLLETACRSGQYCDLTRGCVDGTVCSADVDCTDADPCTTGERCDTSFPRRCTHNILDADGDREASTACGGSDCADTDAARAAMAHQVCGSAVDADCDGLIVFDDLLGTNACATDILRGGLAACLSDPFAPIGWGVDEPTLRADIFQLDVTDCSAPLAAVTALGACESRASCESAVSCTGILNWDFGVVTDSISAAWTNCAADFRAACTCSSSMSPCPDAVGSICTGTSPTSAEYSASGVMGSTPSFDVCRDLNTDTQHCGACGTACATGDSCIRGTCCASTVADCDGDPATACETDLLTSNANCGACGHACGGGSSCVAGTCTCPTGLTLCGGVCTDIQTDTLNCGGCGVTCSGATSLCGYGQCQCDPLGADCGGGMSCLYGPTGFFCSASPGTIGPGALCGGSSLCIQGYSCDYAAITGRCMQVCRTRGDCAGPDEFCDRSVTNHLPGYGVCRIASCPFGGVPVCAANVTGGTQAACTANLTRMVTICRSAGWLWTGDTVCIVGGSPSSATAFGGDGVCSY